MGKKTSEKRGKLFGVLNILDLIILLFLLSLGAALAFRGNVKDQLGSTADDVTVEFSVRIEPVRVMTYMAVEEGDPLFDNETGTRIGTVTRVSATPYMREVTLADGSIVTSPDPEYFTLIVVAQGPGKTSEIGVLLDGSRLCSPGGTIKLASTRLDTTGTFNTVEVVS